jgi:hypothetical protein
MKKEGSSAHEKFVTVVVALALCGMAVKILFF